MRRAQMSQVFQFLTVVIVIIATIYLGFKLLGNLIEPGCDIGRGSLPGEIERTLSRASAMGSRNQYGLSVPCDAEEIIFVDADLVNGSMTLTELAPKLAGLNDPVIKASVKNGVQKNIFIKHGKTTEAVTYSERVLIKRDLGQPLTLDPYLIIPADGGSFPIFLTGWGYRVRVEAP